MARGNSPSLAPLILQLHLSDLPNPATLQLEQVRPDATIVLCEALGCELMRQRVSGYHNTLDIADLPEGVFVVELRTADQSVAAERNVTQR